ncbi:hypothetical protein [Chryseolinea lacunae]|uniref:Uncharacterized protein n=1 Tax=Chryseolinea lacunae TaxID=2801331 RepID=A0ABS1KKW2_9BACT|nr:hypothetical protein [Chryseolinea lacunae]MBL0739873.1 hypothetical protein [Chryseolinea lacunae]
MIKKGEFTEFLKFGWGLAGVGLDQKTEVAQKTLGEPISIVGEERYGFYEYDQGLRIGYMNGEIDEVGIVFFGKKNIVFDLDLNNVDAINTVTEKTTIHEFIKFLNVVGIKWRSYDEANLNVFCIITKGNAFVLFDLETGCITRAMVVRANIRFSDAR